MRLVSIAVLGCLVLCGSAQAGSHHARAPAVPKPNQHTIVLNDQDLQVFGAILGRVGHWCATSDEAQIDCQLGIAGNQFYKKVFSQLGPETQAPPAETPPEKAEEPEKPATATPTSIAPKK